MFLRIGLFLAALLVVAFNLIAQILPTLFHVYISPSPASPASPSSAATRDVFIGFWRQCLSASPSSSSSSGSGDSSPSSLSSLSGLSECSALLLPGCVSYTPNYADLYYSNESGGISSAGELRIKYDEVSSAACARYVASTYMVVAGLIFASFAAAAAVVVVFRVGVSAKAKRGKEADSSGTETTTTTRYSLFFWILLAFCVFAFLCQLISLSITASVRALFTELAALAKSYYEAASSDSSLPPSLTSSATYVDAAYDYGAAFWVLLAGTVLSFFVPALAYFLYRQSGYVPSKRARGWKSRNSDVGAGPSGADGEMVNLTDYESEDRLHQRDKYYGDDDDDSLKSSEYAKLR